MKALFTSDWHLDWTTGGHSRFDEICAAIDHSVALATQENADLYVFAGDLSDPDSHGVHRAQAKAIEVARKLHQQGIRSIWVAGNHDVVEDGFGTTTLSPLAATELAMVFEQPAIVDLGATMVIALPFTPRSHAYDPEEWVRKHASKLPAKRRLSSNVLVVGHLSISGLTPGSETSEMPRGREVTWPVRELRKWLPKALLVGGHYHKSQSGEVHIVGSLARLTHGEEENAPSILLAELP